MKVTVYTQGSTFTGDLTHGTAEQPDHEAIRLCEEMGWEIETSVALRDVVATTAMRRLRHPLVVLPKSVIVAIGFPDDAFTQVEEAVGQAQVVPFEQLHEDN